MPPLPNFTAIEFPGVLRDPNNPSGALQALGGEKTVRTYIATPPSPSAPTLLLNLRPANDVSQSNISSEPARLTPNLFLIQIDTTSPSLASSSTAPTPTLTARLTGRVTSITEFRSLSDFQYHPCSAATEPYLDCQFRNTNNTDSTRTTAPLTPDAAAAAIARDQFASRGRGATAERIFHALTRRPSKNLTLEQCVDRLRPQRFARPAPERGNTNYWYRQYTFLQTRLPGLIEPPLPFVTGRPLGEDGRSQPDRLDRLPHRVSYTIDAVPNDAPPLVQPPVFRGRALFAQLVALLRLLFQKRPVWVRRALLLGVPPELRAHFKKAIACVAYSFQGSGAFFQACVKYGYDPRKDPNSRKYQVLEVRCGHPLLEAVRLVREKQEDLEKEDPVPHAIEEDDDMDLESQKAGTSRITLDLFRMPAEFILKDLPRKKNNFFQICDIQLEDIINVVAKQEVTKTYDSKNGFFTEAGMATVMASVKNTLFQLAKDFLGQEPSKQLLRGDFQTVKLLKSKKRGRLHLKDVMKRGEGDKRAKLPVDVDGKGAPRCVTRSASRKVAADSEQNESKQVENNDVADDGEVEDESANDDDGSEREQSIGEIDANTVAAAAAAAAFNAANAAAFSFGCHTATVPVQAEDDDDGEDEGVGPECDDSDDEDDEDEEDNVFNGEDEDAPINLLDSEVLTGFEVYDSDSDAEGGAGQLKDYTGVVFTEDFQL